MTQPTYSEEVKIYHTAAGKLAAEALSELRKESNLNFPPISFERTTFTSTYVSLCDSEGKEFARVNFQLKRITTSKPKIIKMFDWQFITLSKAKGLGWNEDTLVQKFGLPILAPNPHFKTSPPMKLWPLHWLQEIIS